MDADDAKETTMSTLTAAAITDLHARRIAKGVGYAPTLAECLDAAAEGRLYDVDTQSAGEDCLWISDDGDAALAEVAASVSPDDTTVPSDWSADVVTLEVDAETQGESAFRAGDGYDVRRGETWCLGWAREQSAHDARIARRTTHEDAVEGRHVGCGHADCPHCAEVRA